MDNSMLFVKVDPGQTLYHIVKFRDFHEDFNSDLHCVPASWIKLLDEWGAVLVAYPDEPEEMTRKRIENYQSPSVYWYSFYAKLIYSTDSYKDAMNYIEERKNIEKSSSKVSMEIESPQWSEPTPSFISQIDESALILELEEEMNEQMNSDPQSLIVNTIDNIINGKSEVSEFEMESKDIYEFKDDVYLNLPFTSLRRNRNVTASRTSQDLGQRNNLLGAANTSHHTDEKWTLKYLNYSPGLVELMPNTGVYLEEAELWNCLRSSRTCSRLTRLLVTNIFTESALRTCTYFGPRRGNQDNRLDLNAVKTIVTFVRLLEYKRSSRVPYINVIRQAIRYQMRICKKSELIHLVYVILLVFVECKDFSQ